MTHCRWLDDPSSCSVWNTFLYLILCIVWKVLWCSRVAVSPVPARLITFHTDHRVRRAERQEACIIFQLFRFYPSEAAVIRVDLRGMKWRHIRRCRVTKPKSYSVQSLLEFLFNWWTSKMLMRRVILGPRSEKTQILKQVPSLSNRWGWVKNVFIFSPANIKWCPMNWNETVLSQIRAFIMNWEGAALTCCLVRNVMNTMFTKLQWSINWAKLTTFTDNWRFWF